MSNFMIFFSSFTSYLILMLVIIVVAAIGFVLGSIVRKALGKKKAAKNVTEVTDETN